MIRVSDHAVLRFLERVHGLDVEALRAAIGAAVARGGRGTKRFGGGLRYTVVTGLCRFVVIDGVVVTTLGRRQVPHGLGREADAR